MKQANILYFINSPMPTDEQLAEAYSMNAKVMFRNVKFISSEEKPEAADGVAGEVPEIYKDYPSAEEAIAAKEEEINQILKKAKDKSAAEKAPEPKTPPRSPQGGQGGQKAWAPGAGNQQ